MRARILSILCALIVTLLGLSVMAGWLLNVPELVKVSPLHTRIAMTLGSALCFTLLGGSLIFVNIFPKLQLTTFFWTGIGVFIIMLAFSELAGTLSNYHIGFDHLLTKYTYMKDLTPQSSRMSTMTTLTFIIIGIISLLRPYAEKKYIAVILEILIFSVLLVGFLNLIGYALDLQDLFSWYYKTRMPHKTAIGFIILSVGIWTYWLSCDWYQALYKGKEERKIFLLMAATLLFVASGVGFSGFGIVTYYNQELLKTAFQNEYDKNSIIIQEALNVPMDELKKVLASPIFRDTLRSSSPKYDLTNLLLLLNHEGFSGAQFLSPEGTSIAQVGNFAQKPSLLMPLNENSSILLWNKKYYLRITADLSSSIQEPYVLIVEWPLKTMDTLMENSIKKNHTLDLYLCHKLKRDKALCMPNRISSHPAQLDLENPSHILARWALQNKKGLVEWYDQHYNSMIASFGAIHDWNLGLVLKQNTAELYSPIKTQLMKFIPIIIFFIFIGFAALYWQVIPLIKDVVRSRAQAVKAKSLLEERESYLRSIMDHMGEGVLTFDIQGIIRSMNSRARDMFGYSHKDSLEGLNIESLIRLGPSVKKYPYLPAILSPEIQAVIGKPRVKCIGVNSEHQEFPIEININKVSLENDSLFVSIALDISARERVELELKNSREQLEQGYNRLEYLYRRSSLLREMSASLQLCKTFLEVYRIVGKYGPQLCPETSAILFTFFENSSWQAQAQWNYKNYKKVLLKTTDCFSLQTGQLYEVLRKGDKELCPHIQGQKNRYPYLCIPLHSHGEAIGLLYVESHTDSLDDSQYEEMKLVLDIFSKQIATTLSNIKMSDKLRFQSFSDPLTGLYNRRFFRTALSHEIARANRSGKEFSLAMMDIDHFKKVNDTFGHEMGDRILKKMAHHLKMEFRETDIICRYGGEEFLILLPESNLEDTTKRCQLFLEKIRKETLVPTSKKKSTITVSIGISTFPDHSTKGEELINMADKALYAAKTYGRNQVRIYNPSLP